MLDVIGVSLPVSRKIVYFESPNSKIEIGTSVVIQNEQGLFIGKVVSKKQIPNQTEKIPSIIRIAKKADFISRDHNIKDAFNALLKCRTLARKHNLDMKVIDSYYTLDRDKLIFRFTSHDRIDFRELAKDLAKIYKVRIELRQVGVRDETSIVGGLGPCGRPLCCALFLDDFNSVSINMAKNQNISLNPTKINGLCGRLLCCLKYENDTYCQCRLALPKMGDEIETEYGLGTVVGMDILKQKIKVEVPGTGTVEVDKKWK